MQDKIQKYDIATQKLINYASNMSAAVVQSTPYDIAETVKRFRDAFRNPNIRRHILNNDFEELYSSHALFSAGFCVVASYVWANIFVSSDGSKQWAFRQFRNLRNYGTHAWLEHVRSGERLDLTFDQFVDEHGEYIDIPYNLGETVRGDFEFPDAFYFADSIGLEYGEIVRKNSLMR